MYTTGKGVVYLKVQLVQNESPLVTDMFKSLMGRFCGNLSSAITLSGKTKLNWQVSSANAAEFLRAIRPYLRSKAEQADIAIQWQAYRDVKGSDPTYDKKVAQQLKDLKG